MSRGPKNANSDRKFIGGLSEVGSVSDPEKATFGTGVRGLPLPGSAATSRKALLMDLSRLMPMLHPKWLLWWQSKEPVAQR